MPPKRPPQEDVRRGKVSEAIVRAIQGQIRRGELAPGDRLPPERRLAQLLGASRGSVREALRILELSGLIASRHGEGTFVADTLPPAAALTLVEFLERQRASLLDLSEARNIFEPALAELAARRATAADLDRMRQAAEEQAQKLRQGDSEAAVRADRAFHHAIATATRNHTLIYLHSYLSDLIASGRREALENDTRRAQSAVDHRRIYQALARRDGGAARAAMLQHLHNVERILSYAVQQYQRTASRLRGIRPAGQPAARVVSRPRSAAGRRRAARRIQAAVGQARGVVGPPERAGGALRLTKGAS